MTSTKLLHRSCLWRDGALVPVPATRADIFAAEGLTLPQRRALTRFLAAVQAAMQGEGPLRVSFALVLSTSELHETQTSCGDEGPLK